jgi:hypothetical protein
MTVAPAGYQPIERRRQKRLERAICMQIVAANALAGQAEIGLSLSNVIDNSCRSVHYRTAKSGVVGPAARDPFHRVNWSRDGSRSHIALILCLCWFAWKKCGGTRVAQLLVISAERPAKGT